MFVGKKGLITGICHGILRLFLLQVVSCKVAINKSGATKAEMMVMKQDW